MWKSAAAPVALLVALCACAGRSDLVPPQAAQVPFAPAAQVPDAGRLHVEPVAIVFRNGRSHGWPVRVWQHGHTGEYRVRNRCSGVEVSLERHAGHDAAIFRVRPNAPGKEKCEVAFSGTGPRGTQRLYITVLNP